MKIKNLIGDGEENILDLHSDPLDGAEYYPKILPSSIREKIIDLAQKRNQAELIVVCNLLMEAFKNKEILEEIKKSPAGKIVFNEISIRMNK
jgi:vacuolar-type H+-ATPase subunit E/Vma4